MELGQRLLLEHLLIGVGYRRRCSCSLVVPVRRRYLPDELDGLAHRKMRRDLDYSPMTFVLPDPVWYYRRPDDERMSLGYAGQNQAPSTDVVQGKVELQDWVHHI